MTSEIKMLREKNESLMKGLYKPQTKTKKSHKEKGVCEMLK